MCHLLPWLPWANNDKHQPLAIALQLFCSGALNAAELPMMIEECRCDCLSENYDNNEEISSYFLNSHELVQILSNKKTPD
jgi:hypothetical protein